LQTKELFVSDRSLIIYKLIFRIACFEVAMKMKMLLIASVYFTRGKKKPRKFGAFGVDNKEEIIIFRHPFF
jgi:hypothetical protein